MTPERFAEIELYTKHLTASGQLVGGCLRECLEAELRAANHRADIAENEEVYSLKRANERMKLALERIASVDARDGSEYALICEMRKTAREALG